MAKILRLGIKNEWILFVLLSTFRNFETFVSKIGGTSEIKMKTVLFCISLGLDKFLTLKYKNAFSYSSLNRNFALSLQRE